MGSPSRGRIGNGGGGGGGNNDNQDASLSFFSSNKVCIVAMTVIAVFVFIVAVSSSIEINVYVDTQEKKQEELEEKSIVVSSQEQENKEAATTTMPSNDNDDVEVVVEQQEERYTYQRRGGPMDDTTKEELSKQWGSWTFVDSNRENRPMDDYYAAFPNRDIPWKDLPSNAWQKDPTYMKEFLSQGKDLIERAMEAILAEYGFGPFDEQYKDQSFQQRSNLLFQLTIVDDVTTPDTPVTVPPGPGQNGGWTTQRSFNGLIRRILHAIVTEDTFTMIMGGHSAAAGHGNHFQQSYTLQFQQVLEPIFARLGVRLISRNIGMGGLGTIQNAMGAGSIYGQEMDMLVWDSGMTENQPQQYDVFARQGLIGGRRVPVLWGGIKDAMQFLNDKVAAEIGYFGTAMANVPTLQSAEKVDTIPWAARYIKCNRDIADICKQNRYNGTCWIDRNDGFQPPKPQRPEPGGRAGWHPGNREHQLVSRVLAFIVLRATHEALLLWINNNDYTLQDDQWHVTDHYDQIRSKLTSLADTDGHCTKNEFPNAFCKVPIKARTEFTPRANPSVTSLRSIMKYPTTNDGNSIPIPVETNLYDPPDVYNPTLFPIPNGEVNFLNIMENGNDFTPILNPYHAPLSEIEMLSTTTTTTTKRNVPFLPVKGEGNNDDHLREYDIVPGHGWTLRSKASPDLCDGTYDSFCARGKDEDCLLYGHNDGRGGLAFDSYAGWGIFTLRGMQHGVIGIRLESWHFPEENPTTVGWTSINNQTQATEDEQKKKHNTKRKKTKRQLLVINQDSNSSSNNNNNNDHHHHLLRRHSNQTITTISNNNNHHHNNIDTHIIHNNNSNNNNNNHHYYTNYTYSLPYPYQYQQRMLKRQPPPICDTFRLEWVINGKIYFLDKAKFEEERKVLERVVEFVPLLDDPTLTNGQIMDVEIAIRMVNCRRLNVLYLSHLYWA